MSLYYYCFVFIAIVLVSGLQAQNNGFTVHGLPEGVNKHASWHERAAIVLINSARMSPKGFAQTFKSQISSEELSALVAAQPLYETVPLLMAAREHSTDMDSNACFKHSDCNALDGVDEGTWEHRVRKYHKGHGTIAENIGFGYPSPQDIVVAWFDSPKHRSNILNSRYTLAGLGFKNKKWTYNAASGTSENISPMVTGSHFFPSPGKITFAVNYFNEQDRLIRDGPIQYNVVIDGKDYPLNLYNEYKYGDESLNKIGTFTVELDQKDGCRSYHFEFMKSGARAVRYPESGELVTFGEGGNCDREFSA
jgi:hypothetical protein